MEASQNNQNLDCTDRSVCGRHPTGGGQPTPLGCQGLAVRSALSYAVYPINQVHGRSTWYTVGSVVQTS